MATGYNLTTKRQQH